GRAAVVYDGARARRELGAAREPARAASRGPSGPDPRLRAVHPRARPRARAGPPGFEAGEHVDRAGRAVAYHGLRPGTRAPRRRPVGRCGVAQWNAAVRRAGAAARRACGPAGRPLLARRDDIFRVTWSAAVRGRYTRKHPRPADNRAAP